MKSKLFYLIGVACLLSYTGTFTSCVNGVDDEYLEQQLSGDSEGSGETEELPDINGDYGKGGDYELIMTCNGEELGGRLVSVATDETNETATLILSGTEVDLETAIATALPGGVGGLISGLGLKYVSNSPIPGEKEVTIPNIPLYKNGTSYKFEGESVQPTYTIAYRGTIEGDKMKIDLNYDLTNQTLAGTWNLADKIEKGKAWEFAPLWCDWNSEVKINLGKVSFVNLNMAFNGIFALVSGPLSGTIMNQIIQKKVSLQTIVKNMLESVTTEPNGCMFASYSYGTDIAVAGPYSSEMPHNALRCYYDPEKPDQRIYLEINADFLVNMIGDLVPSASTRVDYDKTKDIGRRLFKLLVPVLQKGIPCEYVLEGDNLTVNIDGVVLRDILRVLMELANDEVIKTELVKLLEGLGDFKQNISTMLETMPDALQYAAGDKENGFTGECQYVKLGFKFVKK